MREGFSCTACRFTGRHTEKRAAALTAAGMHSGRMTQPTLFPREQQLSVLSASRRTDLVACYPEFLIEKLCDYPPEQVHSLVIWTKNPQNMIAPGALRDTLERYSQLYVHLTMMLGGTVLEPHFRQWKTVQEMAPPLIALVKNPKVFPGALTPYCAAWPRKAL